MSTVARTLPILLGGLLGIAAIWFGLHAGVSEANGWQLAARWTARVGFPVFLVTYSASSLYRVFPNDVTRHLLRTRRQWGLGFALAHTIHLFALITYFRISGVSPNPVTLIGGGFGYVILYAMALTSNDWAMAKLDRNWKRLHRLGIHTLWGIYVFSYLGRLVKPHPEPVVHIYMALALTALMLRFMLRRRVSA
jgi:methionine sulfoxide reductase heme-binding subunit